MLTSNSKQAADRSQFYLEKEGKRYSKEIARAVRQIHWLLRVFQLIWIAGPVTYIALQGGYYVGYGKFAPFALFIYFASYTLIAGLIGAFATVLYQLIYRPKQDKAYKSLSNTIDKLTDFLAIVRDSKLSDLSSDYKQREAARIILENTHADAHAIKLAIKIITNNDQFAHKAAEIETYRRAGLLSCAKDCKDQIIEDLDSFLIKLEMNNPTLGALVRKRFFGQSPTLKEGLPRSKNFIRRLLLASKEENELLITPRDIEEIIMLSLELLAGREFKVLTFKYKGNRRISRAYDKLEKERSSYELAVTSYRSRVKALYVYLSSLDSTKFEEVSLATRFEKQVKQCENGLEQSYQATKGSYLTTKQANKINKHTAKSFEEFKKAFSLYKTAYKQIKRIKNHQRSWQAAVKEWETLSNNLPDAATELRLDRGRGGLRIEEQDIGLSDDEKIKVAFRLEALLQEYSYFLDWLFSPSLHGYKKADPEKFKQLAIDIALILSEYLPLDNSLVQYAIESSPATNLLSIEIGTTTKTKVGFLTAMVCEVNDNRATVGEAFAKALVLQYGMNINDSVLEFLENSYNVPPENIAQLGEGQPQGIALSDYIVDWQTEFLTAPRKHWLRLFNGLGRY